MAYDIHIGDTVSWKWGEGTASGEVTERFTNDVTRTIDGTEVTRKASNDEPAYLIRQQDGQEVLKSASELQAS